MRHSFATSVRTLIIRLLAVVALGVAMLGNAQDGRARLHPYYVLQGASFGQISPRILFVLDTSGSMAWRAQSTAANCEFASCEDGTGSSQSRIAAARKAIKQVIEEKRDQASFGLMTFDKLRSPNSNPQKCDGDRFMWVDTYTDISWTWLSFYPGYYGHWALCDDDKNRPYPYLRYDDLGRGAVISSDDQTGPIPSSPLISISSSNMKHSSNRDRKVQWFSTFDGVRVNYDCGESSQWDLVRDSTGDYGTNNSSKYSNVCGKDFYYWPYVDGFPGYSRQSGALYDDCYTWRGEFYCEWVQLGVVEEDTSAKEATLYGPFYMDLSGTSVNPNYWGPASEEDAEDTILRYVSPMIEGGVDAEGSTPWTEVVGTIPAAPSTSNSVFAHTTVASYLKFASNVESADVCAPTAAVLVTDGEPDCVADNAGCGKLYQRLSDLRRELNVRTYVVGFFQSGSVINQMACAAAGSCTGNGSSCSNPCGGTPAKDWDTCLEPDDHSDSCNFSASSPEALASVLTEIVQGNLDLDVGAGPGAAAHDFGTGAGNQIGDTEVLQTRVSGYTEWPGWKGHVVRSVCNDRVDPEDPNSDLQPWCEEPTPAFAIPEETFGPCPQGRNWDAGECLQQMDWEDRRLYTNNSGNQLIPISNGQGDASPQFRAELLALGLIDSYDSAAQANDIARFILGKDWPDGWKLPGLANSAPMIVRRVPPYDEKYLPSVSIRDPHCGGRSLSATQNADVPAELIDFAKDAWEDKLSSPSEHYRYQEAVLVGDDLGILHAFQLDSGNELWGFLPRFLLESAAAQAEIGVASRGQPEDVKEHIFGIASTINHGWVWDSSASDADDHRFRHVGVFGLGAGGSEFIALELSHMSPASSQGPFEILWTSEDAALKDDYDDYNGETWARPALTYELDHNLLTEKPKSYVVLGSGYPQGDASQEEEEEEEEEDACSSITNGWVCYFTPDCAWSGGTCHSTGDDDDDDDDDVSEDRRGRVLMLADAITGEIQSDGVAELEPPTESVYETSFGTVVDPAIASHCRSRFWAEMEEAYIVDPAGRLFRWDLGHPESGPGRTHAADSGGEWNGSAQAVFRFPACQGTGDTCTVSSSNKGDPFAYGVAVTANDRLDDFNLGSSDAPQGTDQMLIAFTSGSSFDDKLDWSEENNDFHSSLYLLVDDHSSGDAHDGFDIPANAPKMSVGQVGSHPNYVRMALSDIPRQRSFQPYEGAPTYTETGTFNRRARPLRAPRMVVKGVVDDSDPGNPKVIDGAEVVYVEFIIYEPGAGQCDERFFNSTSKQWYLDEGATYRVTFRLTVEDGQGFDFSAGYGGDAADFGDEETGLVLVGGEAEQITQGECADGNCGPTLDPPAPVPCDNNDGTGGSASSLSIPLTRSELTGFSPIE